MILRMEGACGVRFNADNEVAGIFKNGRVSISLGYIDIYEMMNALYGNSQHVFDDILRAKAIKIVEHLSEATRRWKDETGYGFSPYSTHSESYVTVYAFKCKENCRNFGRYTNSFHFNVEKR